jgi:hypothetical protein
MVVMSFYFGGRTAEKIIDRVKKWKITGKNLVI